MKNRNCQFMHADTHRHPTAYAAAKVREVYRVDYTDENIYPAELEDIRESDDIGTMREAMRLAVELTDNGRFNVSIHQRIEVNGQWVVENTIYQISDHLHADPLSTTCNDEKVRAEVAELSASSPTDTAALPSLEL